MVKIKTFKTRRVSMERDKIIRKIGDSIGIIFNKEEKKLFKLNIGDSVNIILTKNQDGDN